jgi:glycosyltransferase involved in cell wall biosynthesis
MKLVVDQDAGLTKARVALLATPSLEKARIAIVHYWFVNQRGGERVVEAIADMFPRADLFSLVANRAALPQSLRGRSINTSFVQKLPGSHRWHRRFLPLYPLALEQFDFGGYDLVISSESGPAKGVLTSARTCHVCYCHSPMRYLWDFYHHYRDSSGIGRWSRPIFTLASHYLRMWDAASADRVDYFAANSRNVAARIRKTYRRESTVIYPPVNVSAGYLAQNSEDFYLVVGHFVDYKRMDLAISACTRLNRRLHVVGEGEQYRHLRKLAGPSVRFCGPLSDEDLRNEYAKCRALLFPGEEDFGIVPVEALSFGRPVIAYGRGGVTESVRGMCPASGLAPERATGVFFDEQSVDSLVEAIHEFERIEQRFSPVFIKSQADRFAPENFRHRFGTFLDQKWCEFQDGTLNA